MDGHKLMYHPQRVSEWLEDKNILPIYVDICPTSACNHRCLFCTIDFLGYKPIFFDKNIFDRRIIEMSRLGIKSIGFAGNGEPLLNKDTADMIVLTKKLGLDAALTTNGVLLNKEFVDKSLGSLSWIKVSCAAGTKETHAKIHDANINDFDKIFDNLKHAIKVKNENNYDVTLGMQFLLLPDNVHEIEILAEKVKNIGLDYLVIKPYSKSRHGLTEIYNDIKYEKYLYLSETLKKFNTDKFNVIFRIDSMNAWDDKHRGYKKCFALPFSAYIGASGNVYGCCAYIDDENFYYGNIYKNTFAEIWNSPERKKSLEWVNNTLNINKCQINCRLDKANKYLWDLKCGVEHVNFI